MTTIPKPVVLLIMDGWGHRENDAHNAVRLAHTPTIDLLDNTVSKSFLDASGPAVGLPQGQVGNSEVGHMTIGAGRIILQDLARIDAAVDDGSLARLASLDDFAAPLIKGGHTAHVMALVSPGGVHSRDTHIMTLIHALTDRGVSVAVHAFTDGRDTLPKLARETLPAFEKALPAGARLASVIGRYYAMDRDNRWERTEMAFHAMTSGNADQHADNAATALQQGYDNGLSDEFILPTVIGDYDGMKDGDALVMGNFRADRARQILSAYCFDETGFDISSRPNLNKALGMVPYSDALDTHMASLFGPPSIPNTLGDVVSGHGKSQLRLAETEKYPHVTFFLNGGEEGFADGEDRALIPSPKVATYDLQPEMSAEGITARLIQSISAREHDLIIVNYANPDMVGHTGDLNAAITAVETVDHAVGQVVAAISTVSGAMIITADHGNCEIMWDEDAQSPHTAHSYNPVPAYLISDEKLTLSDGGLSDLAPSLLDLMGLDIPAEMTGQSLIRR